MTFKYDINVVIPLLMVCFHQLNLTTNAHTITIINVAKLNLKKNMFGGGPQLKNQTQIIEELSLFRRLSIPSCTHVDPLTW